MLPRAAKSSLYGTTAGTVFKIHTDGTGFSTLHTFTQPTGKNSNSDGAGPTNDLILLGDTLYGTTEAGGSSGNGTVFSLSIPPELMITLAGLNVVLTWPTNFTGFTLKSTTNVGSSAVWATNSAAPVVVNGQYTVTNPISGTQQFSS